MLPAMGLLGRIVGSIVRTKAEHHGARLEAQGKLEQAYEAYLAAGQPSDAARIMLARAGAETDPRKRIAMLNLAASRAPDGSETAIQARRRAALLRLDICRNANAKQLRSELVELARELEHLELMPEAGETFGLAGDTENQTRVLVACGAIDALEHALESERQERSDQRHREQAWREIKDLDAIGKRRACLQRCEAWLADHPLDEDVAAFARSVREKILRDGTIPLIIEGNRANLVIDHPLIVGRAEASVEIPSPALSRQHLQVSRRNDEVVVEDLGSRNGTWLAGARIDGVLPVGTGIDLQLGGQVPCRVEPWPAGGVKLSMPGRAIVAPLGPLHVGSFQIAKGPEGVVQLRASHHAPVLNGLQADHIVDLAYGDRIQANRNSDVVLEVVAS